MVVPAPAPEPEAALAGELERSTRDARFGGEWIEAEVLRGEPGAGTAAEGPCVFELPEATLVLPPGWGAEVDERGTIAAERVER
jgi:N-methylhydantoinase A/oxoprolinase/acetone carboxylase beta subunit